MRVGEGGHQFDWHEHWAMIPDSPTGRANGRTHGIEVTAGGEIVVFSQATPAVLFFDGEGNLRRSWGDRFPGAHGLTLVVENGVEYLWLTDHDTGEVVKTTLDGRTVLNIVRPGHRVYESARYAPTWVAVCEERFGGSGDVWVTDGYGSGYIHRYDKGGRYLGSFNGEEGRAGAFKCPHAIFLDTRRGEPEIYIADRGNHRIQVYDLEGTFKRQAAAEHLTSPCAFDRRGEFLLVPELFARVTILDLDDRPVCRLGANEPVKETEGWPDLKPPQVRPGKFNSPHDAVFDREGNIFVVEWIIGGRITKLGKRED